MKEFTKKSFEGLSIHDAINYTKELVSVLPTLNKPRRPVLVPNCTSEEATVFAEDLKKYESIKDLYLEDRKARGDESSKIYDVLEDHLKEESGMYDNVPEHMWDKVWNYAWEKGHSSGYSEVYSYLQELVELFE